MTKIASALLLASAVLGFASCGYLAGSNSGAAPSAGNSILQFQSSDEQLTLPGLQVGATVYPDVALRLAKDGSWRMLTLGSPRPVSAAEFVPAVLSAPAGAVIDPDWRPADATITIRRLHIDDKVYGNVALRLTGDTWSWVSELQELSALTAADFNANPSLVATETHHVVLQSSPGNGAQSYPVKLAGKVYKFCMDAQDEGADALRLLDPAGAEVFSLKAGDPCVNIKPAAGVYTMQHSYGGAGSKRMVFVRPATAAAAAPAAPTALASPRSIAPTALAASDPNHPEYWAVYADNLGQNGYLTFNGTNYYGGNVDPGSGRQVAFGCYGQIQAAASLGPYYSWPGDPTTRTRYFFDAANFFEVTRFSDGRLSSLGLPLICSSWPPLDGSGRSVDPAHHSFALDSLTYRGNAVSLQVSQPWPEPLWIVPLEYSPSDPAQSAVIDANMFVPVTLSIASYGSSAFEPTSPTDNNLKIFTSQIIEGFATSLLTGLGSGYDVGVYGFYQPGVLTLGFRYFPNGLPPSMGDGSGAWTLAQGEVAMFSGSNCSGAAMISEAISMPYPVPAGPISELALLGSFAGSLQLGSLTTATVYSGDNYQGQSHIFNESGCLNFSSAGFAHASIEISTDAASIVVQTNSCEYCNLAGVDLQNLDLSKNIKLQHANLADAQLSRTNLSNADLRFATLQGAKLNYANLESTNLCQAALNAGRSGAAASLSGAHLKNANLYGADLDGAEFAYASFYSDAPQSCQSACNTYAKPVCASAYGASMDSTRFANAYLAGVDMSNINANGANFAGAMLFGASFKNANLNRNAVTGASSDFSYAFLQGTDFSNAQVGSANFTNAYVDSDASATCIQTNLNNEYTGFPGLLVSNAAGQCVTGMQSAPTCIQYVYRVAHLPATDASNSCPDGSFGPCAATAWTSPRIALANSSQKTSSCSTNPICDGFVTPLNSCW